MIRAINSPTSQPSAPTATAVLTAQLGRYQKELSECINCASAKTPEGKSNIEAIEIRISDIKARLEQASNRTPPAAQPINGQHADTAQATSKAGGIDIFV